MNPCTPLLSLVVFKPKESLKSLYKNEMSVSLLVSEPHSRVRQVGVLVFLSDFTGNSCCLFFV